MPKNNGKGSKAKNTEENAEKQAQKVEKYLADVKSKISTLVKSDRWAQYLVFCSKLRQYSFTNTLLLFMQDPEATTVRTAKQWTELGRVVTPEAIAAKAGALLYRPFFQRFPMTVTDKKTGQDKLIWVNGKLIGLSGFVVFDVRHTIGKELPTITDVVTEGFKQDVWDKLVELTASEKLKLEFKELAASTGGYYDGKGIVLNTLKPQAHQLKTFIHELTHHFNDDLNKSKKLEDRSKQLIEVIAEGTAYYVASALGIDTSAYSIGYLAGWSAGNLDLVEKAGQRIVSTGEKFVKFIKGDSNDFEPVEHETNEVAEEAAD